MIELKFRAYIKRIGWVVPVERINFDVQTVEVDLTDGNGDFYEYDFGEVELMQYTGLKDENGAEIYEGDILRATPNGTEHIGKVYYEDAQWFGACDYLGYAVAYSGAEVIGNIWENPELLK